MRKLTRRQLFAVAAAIPGASLLPVISPAGSAISAASAHPAGYRFFDPVEARFIEAACERLIPADPCGPGAREAGVPRYLDEHLADTWGSGERLHRLGYWQPGTPCERGQPLAPAELFRAALSAIHRDLSARGTSFAELSMAAQDAYLAGLEAGAPLPGIATGAFFDLLLTMTAEGYFASAAEAAHRERLGWPLRGFPGAHASTSTSGGRPRSEETAGDIP